MLDKIIGQDKIKDQLSRLFEIYIDSNCEIRPHFILTGQSGSGKTLLIKSLSEQFNVQFLEINAAQLTKEGMSGNSISKALSPLLNYDLNKPLLVFVDEFDKLFITGNSNDSMAQEYTVGVQNEFLKVIESSKTSVFGDYGKFVPVNTDKILFVFVGTFNGEEGLTIPRLREIGIKNEFLGRVSLLFHTECLTLQDLKQILIDSPLLNKYCDLYDYDDSKRDEIVNEISEEIERRNYNNNLGARMINTLIHQYFIQGEEFKEEKQFIPQRKSRVRK